MRFFKASLAELVALPVPDSLEEVVVVALDDVGVELADDAGDCHELGPTCCTCQGCGGATAAGGGVFRSLVPRNEIAWRQLAFMSAGGCKLRHVW